MPEEDPCKLEFILKFSSLARCLMAVAPRRIQISTNDREHDAIHEARDRPSQSKPSSSSSSSSSPEKLGSSSSVKSSAIPIRFATSSRMIPEYSPSRSSLLSLFSQCRSIIQSEKPGSTEECLVKSPLLLADPYSVRKAVRNGGGTTWRNACHNCFPKSSRWLLVKGSGLASFFWDLYT